MEERLRFCESCRSVIGNFALFCESCGHRQEHVPVRTVSSVDVMEQAPGRPASQEPDDATTAPPSLLEIDPRLMVREMFRAQVRLIASASIGAESLHRTLGAFADDLRDAEKAPSVADRREHLERLSDALSEVEHRWDELQRSYNRDSERLEEEADEKLATLDMDAYLSPDEQAEVAEAHSNLDRTLTAVATALEDCGKSLATARRRTQSRFLGMPASEPRTAAWILAVAAALFATSIGILMSRTSMGLSEVLQVQAPAIAGLVLVGGLLALRR